jgi:hypothetical protein
MTPIPVLAAMIVRGLSDYRHVFDLDDTELRAGPILDCAAGSSPFAAHARARGAAVTSVDSPLRPVSRRHRRAGRGQPGPRPGWLTAHLRLTLSANLLFVYTQHLSYADHLAALLELVRVTHGEIRLHPLRDPTGTAYPQPDQLRATLAHHDVATELRPVTKSWLLGASTRLCAAQAIGHLITQSVLRELLIPSGSGHVRENEGRQRHTATRPFLPYTGPTRTTGSPHHPTPPDRWFDAKFDG